MILKTKNDWDNNLVEMERFIVRLAEAGHKVNAEKSFFGRYKCEYLGFCLTRDGILPLAKKVESIYLLEPPTTVGQVRRFVGLVDYY